MVRGVSVRYPWGEDGQDANGHCSGLHMAITPQALSSML